MKRELIVIYILLINRILPTRESIQSRISKLNRIGGQQCTTKPVENINSKRRENTPTDTKLEEDAKMLDNNLNRLIAYLEKKEPKEIEQSRIEKYFDLSVATKTYKDKYLELIPILKAKYPNQFNQSNHSDRILTLNYIDGIIPRDIYILGEILALTSQQNIGGSNSKEAITPHFSHIERVPTDTTGVLITPYTQIRNFTTGLRSSAPDNRLALSYGETSQNKSMKSSPILLSQYRTRTNNKIFSLIVKSYMKKQKEDISIGILRMSAEEALQNRRRSIRKFQVAVSNMIYWSTAAMMSKVHKKEESDSKLVDPFLKKLKGTPDEVVKLFIPNGINRLKTAKHLASDLSMERVNEGYINWLIRLRMSLLFLSKSKGDLINAICKNSSFKEDVEVECQEEVIKGKVQNCVSTQIVDLVTKGLGEGMTIRHPNERDLDEKDIEEDLEKLTTGSLNPKGDNEDAPRNRLVHILKNSKEVEKVKNDLMRDAQSTKKDISIRRDSKDISAIEDKKDGLCDLYLDHYYNLEMNENESYWFYSDRTLRVDIEMGLILHDGFEDRKIAEIVKMQGQKILDEFTKKIHMLSDTVDTLHIKKSDRVLQLGYSSLPEYIKIDHIINFFMKNFSGFKKVIISNVCLDYFPRTLLSAQNTRISYLKLEDVVYIGPLLSSIMDYIRDKLSVGKGAVAINMYKDEFIEKYLTDIYDTSSIDSFKKAQYKEEIDKSMVKSKILKGIEDLYNPKKPEETLPLQNFKVDIEVSGINSVKDISAASKSQKDYFALKPSNFIKKYKINYADLIRMKKFLETIPEFEKYVHILNQSVQESLYESIVLNSPVLKNICISNSLIPYTVKVFNPEEKILTDSLTGLIDDKLEKTATAIEKIIINGKILDSLDFLSRLDSKKIYSIHFGISTLHDLYAVRYITSINSQEDVLFAEKFISLLKQEKHKIEKDVKSNVPTKPDISPEKASKAISTMIENIEKASIKEEIDRELGFDNATSSYTEKILMNLKKTKLRALEKHTKVIGISFTEIDLTKEYKKLNSSKDRLFFLHEIDSTDSIEINQIVSYSPLKYFIKVAKGKSTLFTKDTNRTLINCIVDTEISSLLKYLKNTQGSIEASYNIIKSIYIEDPELILTKSFTILEPSCFPGVTCRLFSSGLNAGIIRLNVYNSTSTVKDPELSMPYSKTSEGSVISEGSVNITDIPSEADSNNCTESLLYFEAALSIFYEATLSTGQSEHSSRSDIEVEEEAQCKLVTPITMVLITFVSNVVGIGTALQENNRKRNEEGNESRSICRFRELWLSAPPLVIGVVPYSLLPYFSINGEMVANEVEFLLSCGFTQVIMPEPERYKDYIEPCCYDALSSLGHVCKVTKKQWIYKERPNYAYRKLTDPEINSRLCFKTYNIYFHTLSAYRELFLWDVLVSHKLITDLGISDDAIMLYVQKKNKGMIRGSVEELINEIKPDNDKKRLLESCTKVFIKKYICQELLVTIADEEIKFIDKYYPVLGEIKKNRMRLPKYDRNRPESIVKPSVKPSEEHSAQRTVHNTLCAVYHIDYILCTPCVYKLVERDCAVRSDKKIREKTVENNLRVITSKKEEEEKISNPEGKESTTELTRSTYFKLLKFMEDERSSQILMNCQYPISLAYTLLTVDQDKTSQEVSFIGNTEIVNESSPSLHTKESYREFKKKMNAYMRSITDKHYTEMDNLHKKLLEYLTNSTYPIFIAYENHSTENNATRKPNTNPNNAETFLNYKLPLVPYRYIDICFDEYYKKDFETPNIKIVRKHDIKQPEADTTKCTLLDTEEKQIEIFSLVSEMSISEIEAILLATTDFKSVFDTFYNREMYVSHASTRATSISISSKMDYLLVGKTSSASALNYKSLMFSTDSYKDISMFLRCGEFIHTVANNTLFPAQKYFSFQVAFVKHEI